MKNTEQKKTKVCGKCGERKKLTEFPGDSKLWSGLSSWCNSCHAGESPTVKDVQPEEVK